MVLRTSERCELGVWVRNEGFSGGHRESFSTTLRNSHTFLVCEVLEAVVWFSRPPTSMPIAHPHTMATDLPAFPDYDLWTEAWWARFPHYVDAHDVASERSWWWRHGYRLKRVHTSPQIVWVCVKCIGKPRPPHNLKDFVFVASTSRSIEGHLKKSHRISNVPTPAGQPQKAQTADAQLTLHETAGVSTSNPEHQAMLARIKRMYDSNVADVLLLEWLVGDNVPFAVARSPRFRRLLKYLNPLTSVPSNQTLVNLVTREYQRAIPSVKQILQTAKGIMHFTFDVWTSRQNISYLEIHAHWVNQDWKHRPFFSGCRSCRIATPAPNLPRK
jgi:hypothetical protein